MVNQRNREARRYQVIKANSFRDHRPAFAGALSWTRPKQLKLNGKKKTMTSFLIRNFFPQLVELKILICFFLEIKDVARICQDLLKNWAFRGEKGPDRPLINAFNVTKDERRLRQVVFLLSVSLK